MGVEDVKRQAPNVGRMRLLGATVIPVESGSRTLKDAMNEALRDWVTNVGRRTTASAARPARTRTPSSSRTSRASSAREARAQMLGATGALPDAAIACVGGGSNAIGLFRGVPSGRRRRALRRRGRGRRRSRAARHAATLTAGRVGVLHGSKSYVLCDDGGQIQEAHSISAGLDYPGVGPEHAWLKESGRATVRVGDRRRGARRGVAGRADRGHPPRARDGARVREARRRSPARSPRLRGRPVDAPRLQLGPWRQGPRDASGAAASRKDATLSGAVSLVHSSRSTARRGHTPRVRRGRREGRAARFERSRSVSRAEGAGALSSATPGW